MLVARIEAAAFQGPIDVDQPWPTLFNCGRFEGQTRLAIPLKGRRRVNALRASYECEKVDPKSQVMEQSTIPALGPLRISRYYRTIAER